jgi:DNA primase large subunit
VFEHIHKNELKKAKEDGSMTAAQLDTIVHPNEYFKRSYLLRNMGRNGDGDVNMEGQ